MPELPEVETTLRGIQPHIQNQLIMNVVVRQFKLRYKIPHDFAEKLQGQRVHHLSRRGKYLLFGCDSGTLLLHLGMSGSLRLLNVNTPPQKHDHIDIEFANKMILRFTDPRRFGAILWTEDQPLHHPLLASLGPEPLTAEFSADYLFKRAQGRTTSIKSFIMDSKIVVGVGNIYAAEALFSVKIHPDHPAGSITKDRLAELVKSIKKILRQAIKQGGTTLKDFFNSEGKPGYFANKLKVYGREGLPCINCHKPLSMMIIGQRRTVFCDHCQL